MSVDLYPAIISHLREMALSLPGKNHPRRSDSNTISWIGWQPPAHRPEATGSQVKLTFSLHENTTVHCTVDVHLHALWAFRAIGPSAESDHDLDGLEELVKSAHTIAQWMIPPKEKK